MVTRLEVYQALDIQLLIYMPLQEGGVASTTRVFETVPFHGPLPGTGFPVQSEKSGLSHENQNNSENPLHEYA